MRGVSASCECTAPGGQRRPSDALELALDALGSHWVWVLRTEYRFSAKIRKLSLRIVNNLSGVSVSQVHRHSPVRFLHPVSS